jgi:hypothetical protein
MGLADDDVVAGARLRRTDLAGHGVRSLLEEVEHLNMIDNSTSNSQRTWLATYGLTHGCSLVKNTGEGSKGGKNISLVLAFSCGFCKWLSLIKPDPRYQGPPNFQAEATRRSWVKADRRDNVGGLHPTVSSGFRLGVGNWELICPHPTAPCDSGPVWREWSL